MAFAELTSGCLADIMSGTDVDKPIVQIISTKCISSAEGNERYRLLLSDGKFLHSFAMLATQMNDLVRDNKLTEFTIISVERYITSMVNKSEKGEKRVLIVLDLKILNSGKDVGKKLGNPKTLVESSASSSAAAKPTPAPARQEPSASVGISNGSSYSSNINNNKPQQDMNSSMANQSMSDTLTHPIASLSPYQNKWVIRARVTNKSAIRTWSNAKGEGKLFSMDLVDESGEIRATAFKEQCDKFYDMIEIDKVYFISKCQLKPANKQFTSLKNDYEMTFSNDTSVMECVDGPNSIPQVQYNFVPISQIANLDPNAILDIIAVGKEASEVAQFTARTSGRELKKREVVLVDQSNASVTLTLWGDEAEKFDCSRHPVVLLKGARISEFNGGKTISMISGSAMKTNPDIPESHKLRGWYDNGGGEHIETSVSAKTGGGGNYNTEWMTFHETKARNLGNGDKPDYFQCKAVVHLVKSANSVYKACPQPECNKKVIDNDDGQYRCEKCNADFSNFKYRLLVNMSIGDWTSNRWVTAFTELAEQMLGKSAQEIGEALENNKEEAEEIFTSINFEPFIFKLRSKVEFYGDTSRNKFTAVSASPIDYKEYNNYLIKNISESMASR